MEIYKIFEKNKIEKEGEDRKDGACCASYPSGNQVDGLPLVAIPKQLKKKEQAAPHADALDHDKHVFECDCFEKVLGNLHNSFEEYNEASHGDC